MSDPIDCFTSATRIAAAVTRGETTALAVTQAKLAHIAARNPQLNAYTDLGSERALREARAVDRARDAGETLGPLAGVPFAVKNLFDIADLTTRAGSKINRSNALATADATLVRRLNGAGGVLLGALNMGEYAYDFTGENAHDGVCRNPHDARCMSGGSSSGSGVATAAGMAPISLGSDTNGSLRVPASLCGVFSLKPTYGRLPRSGTFPFVDSLDHVGPMARNARDLALAYDVLQGHDAADHACAARPPEASLPTLENGVGGLRIGVLGGWFHDNADARARSSLALAARAFKDAASTQTVTLDGASAARAAAYLITNAESSAFHLERLRTRAADFDADTRDRFLAGALLPAAWITKAQRVRRWWLQQVMMTLRNVDVLLAPATPCTAPMIGEKLLRIGERDVPLRPSLGLLAQPFSCIGLPVATVPVFTAADMPMGVQIIAAPWREAQCLRAAAFLENAAVAVAHPPP